MAGQLTQKNGRRLAGGKPIPKSDFALPDAGGGQGGYPIDTPERARNALSRIAQFGSDDEKAKVRTAVRRRYKGMGQAARLKARATASATAKATAAHTRAGHGGGHGGHKHANMPEVLIDMAAPWLPSKEYWSGIDAKTGGSMPDKGGSDEEKADNHIQNARNAAQMGNHKLAMQHLARANTLTSDPAKQAKINTVGKGVYQMALSSGHASAVGMANPGMRGILMAGGQMTCPNCGYADDSAKFAVSGGADGTSAAAAPGVLRTPSGGNVSSTGYSSQQTTVRTGAGGPGLANGGGGIELARRLPVRQADDLMVTRGQQGQTIIRHRAGGTLIGEIRRNGQAHQAIVDGSPLTPHTYARAAILEAIGVYNRGVTAPPVQPPPQQTALMQQYGVPAIRLAADDSDDDSDDSTGSGGLSAKGQGIYKKLIAKGLSPKVAMAMARRSQNAVPGKFSTSTSSAS